MSQTEILSSLGEAQRKHLDAASPLPMRMMAAKGMAPLAPRESVIVLAGFLLDTNEQLRTAAHESLGRLPEKILSAAVESGLPAPALAPLFDVLERYPNLLEKLVLSRQTPDDFVAKVAARAPAVVVEIIANDQERALRSEAIVRGLVDNPNLLRSSLDRVFDFLVRAGVIYADLPHFDDALARLSPSEMQETADKIELPPEVLALVQEGEEDAARAETIAAALDADETEDVKTRVPMLKLVSGLSAAQKVALAIKGNKEARAILVRDKNRVVAGAAIRNPRITEQEVVLAATSRSVSDEVVRIIAGSKDLARAYAVKVALVNNPKTPLPNAMRFLTLLREHDVRAIAKSRNVTSAIASQAKRLLAAKK